jgi:hypothetical protein
VLSCEGSEKQRYVSLRTNFDQKFAVKLIDFENDSNLFAKLDESMIEEENNNQETEIVVDQDESLDYTPNARDSNLNFIPQRETSKRIQSKLRIVEKIDQKKLFMYFYIIIILLFCYIIIYFIDFY